MQSIRLGLLNTLTAFLPRDKTPNECSGYDIKPSDGEALALEIWGMKSNPSLPLLPGLVWLGVVAPNRVLSMVKIEPFDI